MCSREVKALKYFKLLSMRYSDKNAVDQKLNPRVKELIFSNLTVLQLCWEPMQISEQTLVFLRGSMTPVTPKMESFEKLVNSWKWLTNATKNFFFRIYFKMACFITYFKMWSQVGAFWKCHVQRMRCDKKYENSLIFRQEILNSASKGWRKSTEISLSNFGIIFK